MKAEINDRKLVAHNYAQLDTDTIQGDGGDLYTNTRGFVFASSGIVNVWSHLTTSTITEYGFTMLKVCIAGYEYERTIQRFYSERYLITLADRFAAEKYEESKMFFKPKYNRGER